MKPLVCSAQTSHITMKMDDMAKVMFRSALPPRNQGVVSLKFEYFDGVDWYDSWGNVDPKKTRQSSAREQSNLTGLPEAVRITLLLDSNPKKKQPNTASGEEQPERPFVFETMVRLNLADVVQSAENASSSADTTASPDQTPGNSGNNN